MSFHFLFRWCKIKAQPGANRLINHLRSNGVPMALASNSPRENIETKISYHQGNFCIWILKNKEANFSGLILINKFHWQYGHTHTSISVPMYLYILTSFFFYLSCFLLAVVFKDMICTYRLEAILLCYNRRWWS